MSKNCFFLQEGDNLFRWDRQVIRQLSRSWVVLLQIMCMMVWEHTGVRGGYTCWLPWLVPSSFQHTFLHIGDCIAKDYISQFPCSSISLELSQTEANRSKDYKTWNMGVNTLRESPPVTAAIAYADELGCGGFFDFSVAVVPVSSPLVPCWHGSWQEQCKPKAKNCGGTALNFWLLDYSRVRDPLVGQFYGVNLGVTPGNSA